ncbi:MAG TPA: G1 family glutamic endopeptidase, partial [Acidimicrobiales bacterium]
MGRTSVLAAFAGATLILAAGGLGSVAGAHPVAAAVVSPTGVLVRANSHQALPLHGGTVDSLNWSGYAVTPSGGGITAVSSTFTVPAAGLVPPGFAATWTGIGGYNTTDL